ncbi:unnamed protein product [Candidula unifasciata]|uniref:RING-type domain-containing protein n=1 Tax=Candidula unifasciata TaxID=100452 RepID=A0A8S3ZBC4_9EUPU|nr:unnamed protein product [Candidula unifasciata]
MAVSTGISEELTCSICLDTFNTPILLPCAHTFCKQCLINVQERSRIRRQQSTQGDGGSAIRDDSSLDHGIGGLPRNTSLANIILSLEEEKRAKNIVCEVCDTEPARAASKNCADCSVVYCLPCFRQLHPMRGAFKYHVIKEVNAPIVRCLSPTPRDMRLGRLTPSRDGYGTDGTESGDEGGNFNNQDQLEKLRRQIKSKRKELNNVMKTVQALLKTTEEETEERMREIRSVCNQINELVGEKEASLLTFHQSTGMWRICSISCCVVLGNCKTVLINNLSDLLEQLTAIQSRSLTMKAKLIPRQPKLAEVEFAKYVASLDFAKDVKLLSPVFTEVLHRPVSMGPALVDIQWRTLDNAANLQGVEITTKVELEGSAVSYLMALPWSDAEYTIMLEATTETGSKYPPICRCIRTLPYVHCFRAKFSPSSCHKKIAVLSAKDEVVHRKCKLANLHNACALTTSTRRLENLEGAMADECVPVLPYVYWESVIHFQIFGKLGVSKLICDVGICKQGCEDGSAILCDNVKSYCAYLARRNNKIALEFWNGPNRDTLPRSIPVLDLDQETEKTIKLGFYFDAMKRLFAIVSPGNNTVLSQFHVKFPNVVPVCGLYTFEHAFVMVKFTDVQKLPLVLSKLMRGVQANQT